MLGPPKPRRLDQPIAVSLDALVPQHNFYRHLEATLDLQFVRDWTGGLYADTGRPSIDPVVFFKLQLIMFFEGLRSERQLIATASLNLAHRWYLGYALDEDLPDHASLTRIRQRLGIDIFQRFFEQVTDRCQAAGLVWGRELYFDATKVAANADLDSLIPRFYQQAKAHIADRVADETMTVAAAPRAPCDDTPAGLRWLDDQHASDQLPTGGSVWNLLQERRLDPRRQAAWGYERMSAWRVSRTDAEATPMHTKRGAALGYHDHSVVDGGKARIILAALVTPADVMENVPMRDLLWRVCFRRKIWPHHVTGDATYGTTEHSVAIEDAGIRAYLPLTDFEHRTGLYGRGLFIYDADQDRFRCPAQHVLTRERIKRSEGVIVYRADPTLCNACSLKAKCTTSDRGRVVHRSRSAAYLEKVRTYHATEAYKKAVRKRQVWVEPLFAEAKSWHGLRRLRLRGLLNANIQGLLIAAGQNLKRLLAATGWGRRHAPCGSLIALPTASQARLARSC